jgi:hypothetical protein
MVSLTATEALCMQQHKKGTCINPTDIDNIFHRLLEVDQNSPEFEALWAAVDEYITHALEAKKHAVIVD